MALTSEQKSSLLYKHYLGAGSTRLNREFFEEAVKSSFVVKPDQLWMYGTQIPCGDEVSGGEDAIAQIKALNNGEIFTWNKSESEKEYPIVKCYKKFALTKVDDGTDSSFLIADENGNQIKNIIPYNFYEELYNYTLYTPDGLDEIPFGVGDWVVDTYSGILTFYGDIPEGIDHDHTPLLSFYQYIGGNGFRQDVNGYEAAVLPLANIKIPYGSAVITSNIDTSDTLYKLICKKANEIEDSFTATYGFDGADKNEGIALSFEKILPLYYSSTHDTVKGYDDSENQNIGTLLSGKMGTSSNTDISVLFVSQGLKEGSYDIKIPVGKKDDAVKINNDSGFILLKLGKDYTAEEDASVVVINTIPTATPVISCALMYWDPIAYEYLPFVNKEETNFDFGFPVVAAQGKIPPSLILNTASLTQYADQITPEYYGPRVATVVIAKSDGNDIKSSDFIVKNTEGWYLDDKITEVKAKYPEFTGKIFLRAGYYKSIKSLEFVDWNNVILEGEGGVTVETPEVILNTASGLASISNINFVTSKITVKGAGNYVLNNVNAPGADFEIDCTGNIIFGSMSFNTLLIKKSESTEWLSIKDCQFVSATIQRDNVALLDSVVGTLDTDSACKNVLLATSYIGTLRNKTEDIYLEGCIVEKYDTTSIPAENINQLPIGSDNAKTSGRFPIFHKDDFKHLKYAEFSHPFFYDESNDIIKLLYDTGTLAVEDNGNLKVCAKADALLMPSVTYKRGDNATDDGKTYLADKEYNNNDSISDVLEDLWHEKADLNEDGKIPLQQLPDSVAYGGLQYVGNWSFEDHNGEYPQFSDASISLSMDKEVDKLQPGWFFIVQEAKDTSNDEDDDNDTPVANQTAIDGVVFTAGDWVICNSQSAKKTGEGWTKIDRAYSDPTYSPLPNKANIEGAKNKPWYWKSNRESGALDLSGNTLITAFSKVNDELKKLQPKKPNKLSKIPLEIKDESEIATMTYRMLGSNMLIGTKLYTKYDSSKTDKIITMTSTEGQKYLRIAYFGDEADVTVKLNDDILIDKHHITIDDTEDYSENGAIISVPSESMSDADHGENYWKGFSVVVEHDYPKEGDYTVEVTVENVTIRGDDAKQDKSYAGSTEISYSFIEPYFPDSIDADSLGTTFFTDRLGTLMANQICCGIQGLKLSDVGQFTNIKCSIPDVYKDGVIPKERLADLRVIRNNNEEDIICATANIDEYVSFETDASTGLQAMVLNASIPITHDDNIIIAKDDTLNFILTIYDLYGEGHEVTILNSKGTFRADMVRDTERVAAGYLSVDSEYSDSNDDISKFGFEFPTGLSLTSRTGNALLKVGRLYNGEHVQEYMWPDGQYIGGVDYSAFKGETIDDEAYAVACFPFVNNGAFLDEASGFTLKIDTIEDYADKLVYNTLNGKTENVIIQCCVVDKTGTKVTSWLNCNKANNGFSIPKDFGDAAMYAGKSTANVKRVTFGRGTYTGDLYIRIGIKKGSDIRFTGIEVSEVI